MGLRKWVANTGLTMGMQAVRSALNELHGSICMANSLIKSADTSVLNENHQDPRFKRTEELSLEIIQETHDFFHRMVDKWDEFMKLKTELEEEGLLDENGEVIEEEAQEDEEVQVRDLNSGVFETDLTQFVQKDNGGLN